MNKFPLRKIPWRLGGISMLVLSLLAVSLMVACSPYKSRPGYDYKLVMESIVIDAPPEQVFQYLGDSDNAREWSVFVDHISTLNGDEVPDGEVGSLRRSFVAADETGKRWDEETLIVEINKRRRLSCYDFQGFGLTTGPLLTEQIYEPMENGKCRLSFTLFSDDQKPTLWNEFKKHFGSYEAAEVFRKNLANIKKYNENGGGKSTRPREASP